MTTNKPLEPSNGMIDHAAASADHAIEATQRAANQALDALSGNVEALRQQAVPLLDRGSEQIGALAQRGADAVRDSSRQLRERAVRVSDATVCYIKDEPVKAILIAAAAGAALMALLGLMARSRHS